MVGPACFQTLTHHSALSWTEREQVRLIKSEPWEDVYFHGQAWLRQRAQPGGVGGQVHPQGLEEWGRWLPGWPGLLPWALGSGLGSLDCPLPMFTPQPPWGAQSKERQTQAPTRLPRG